MAINDGENLIDLLNKYRYTRETRVGISLLTKISESDAYSTKDLLFDDNYYLSNRVFFNRFDAVNSALEFFGLLYIAILTGYVEEFLPADVKKEIENSMSLDIISYCQNELYFLPLRLLEKINNSLNNETDYGNEILPLVIKFLDLAETVKIDRELRSFFRLDSDVRYTVVVEICKSRELIENLLNRKFDRTFTARSLHVINGYFKFLGFLENFDQLIAESEIYPELENLFATYFLHLFKEADLDRLTDVTRDIHISYSRGALSENAKIDLPEDFLSLTEFQQIMLRISQAIEKAKDIVFIA